MNSNDIETDLIDSNGRPFRFDSLFGHAIPTPKDFAAHKHKSKSKKKKHNLSSSDEETKVNLARVDNCLSQLGPIIEDRLDHNEQSLVLKQIERTLEEEDYIPGKSDPWTSIHFDVSEGLQVEVSHRTRVDCGLPPRQLASLVPNTRQQRALDAAYEVELLEEKSKVISEKSALFLEKSRFLEQRRQGNRGQKQNIRSTLNKQKSALSLKYLN